MEKDRMRRLISRPDFAGEQDREDGQIVWWGERVDLLAPDDKAERWLRRAASGASTSPDCGPSSVSFADRQHLAGPGARRAVMRGQISG